MSSCAVVRADGLVINIIVADPLVDAAPFGCSLIDITEKLCGIAWTFNGSEFINPYPVDPNPPLVVDSNGD